MPRPLRREFLYDLYRTYQRDLGSLTVFDDAPAFGAAYHKEERQILYMWNPSLWLRKCVERESEAIVPVPFTPLRPPPLKALVYDWRQRRLARMQRS